MFQTFALNQPHFYLYGLYFILIMVFVIIAPALVLLKPLKINSAWQRLTLAFVSGTSLWTIQGFVLGYLRLRGLSYILIGLALFLVCKNFKYLSEFARQLSLEIKRTSKILLFLLFIGVFAQMVSIFSSGFKTLDHQQVNYYFTNSVDAIMHLSFIGGMIKNFPPLRPEIYPLPLTSYHYLSDLFQADLARVFYLPINHLFFHYLPPFISLFTALSLAMIIKFFTKNNKALAFAWILLFFAADSGWAVSLYLHHQFKWTAATIDNGIEQFLNFPQTLAKLNFYAAISLLLHFWKSWAEKKDNRWFFGLWLVLISLVIVGYKVYYGLFFVLALGLVTTCQGISAFFKNRHSLLNFWHDFSGPAIIGLGVALPSLIIYLSNNSQTGGLIWVPLAWPELLLSSTHLDDIQYFLTQQYYVAIGSFKGTLKNTVWALGVGLLSTLGLRLLGLWPLRRRDYPAANWQWQLFIYPVTILFIILGLNTLQTQGGFNTFNFLIVAANVLIIPLALNLAVWWEVNLGLKTLVIFILALTLPRSLHNFYDHLQTVINEKADFYLLEPELELLDQARRQLPPGAIVQPSLQNENSYLKNAYLDFLSNHPTYLSSTFTLSAHGTDFSVRESALKEIFGQLEKSSNLNSALEQLHQLNIDYLYLQNASEQFKFIDSSEFDMNKIVLQNESGFFISTH